MLHELLLALNGCPGAIFVRNLDKEIRVVDNLPFIHSTEVALLNRLCKLATHYSNFEDFIKDYGRTKSSTAPDGTGLYLKALCQGLDNILGPYRQALVDIEKELLKDPHLTPTYVLHALEEYQLLFPALWNILDQIRRQKIIGCQVLDLLHKSCDSGVPVVTETVTRLLNTCHQVFFKQLAGWMLHGLLLDPYNEFIVMQYKPDTSKSNMNAEDESSQTLSNLQSLSLTSQKKGINQFIIRAEMLPSYIPVRVAEKIQFVGESVQMFEAEHSGRQKHRRQAILHSKEDEFSKKLHHLAQKPVFSLMVFEEVIDEIKTYVSQQLWKLVVEEAELLTHMRKVKEMFLLGRGELFLALIEQAHGLLRGATTPNTQHDANQALQQAARSILLEDEKLMQQFTFKIKGTTKGDKKESTESGWDSLNMSYAVQWPLHILFSQSILDKYNAIFRFLLYVKRTQLELQKCWALQMHHGKQDNQIQSERWWLRNHMAFLVDNLQYYMQVDVIESQFTILSDKVHTTRDFEEIRLAHDHFIASLLSQSFLHIRQVHRCLMEILSLCHTFCSLLQQPHHLPNEQDQEQFEQISKGFERQSSLLLAMLSSVGSQQAAPHLAQLLLRLDFNKYFTEHNNKVIGSSLGAGRSNVGY